VILGAGTVAEFAARTALGLGAEVKIFDNRIYRLRRIKYNLGQQIFTSTLDGVVLTNSIAEADVVIGALRPSHGRAPVVVTEEMICNMQANSIIIDVSIDNGGCFETSAVTSHKSPTFRKHDVIHYCVPNIASRVPRTASTAVSNIFVPYLLQASEMGGMENMIRENSWFMKGVYMYKGMLCNSDIAEKYEMQYKDLDLIMMSSF
jgi:alanine dehydrogenase